MKNLFLFFFILTATVSYGQEICDDAIDNDGDGLIDLLDPDCDCAGFGLSLSPTSLIPNPSFEDYSCCPTSTSMMSCADGWTQASSATADYLNTCMGFTSLIPFNDPALPPPGGGDGYAGFHNSLGGYKEYIGACLTGPMLAGTCYQMNLWVAHSSGLTSIDLTLFGSPNCADKPWAGSACPIGSGSWQYLADANVVVAPSPGGAWTPVTLSFTPAVDINVIAIGPDCASTPGGYNYFFVDELILAECTAFSGGAITESGNWCDGDLLLTANLDTVGGSWQWYQDSIALIGETASTLDLMSYGPGDYTAVYTIGSDCEGMAYTVTIPDAPVADFTFADGCEGVSVSFTDASTLSGGGSIVGWDWDFGDGGTSALQNPSHTYVSAGTYTVSLTVTSDIGCTNTITQTITINPQPNAGLDNSTVVCNNAGSTVDLNTLLSGADPGGTWAETSASGSFNPATGVLTATGLGAGAYTFTYTVLGTAPCVDDVANFTVNVSAEANAGADNTTTSCNVAGSSVNLNTLLVGADPGGTWAETTASGAFSAATGVLTTGGLAAGTYSFTYTVAGVAPCPSDVANFSVTVGSEANAGLDNTTDVCNTAGSTVDLNTLLSGADPGGTWAETTASGAFNPLTGVLSSGGLAAGSYTFTYTAAGVAPCPDDVADFTVNVAQEVNAGADNTTTACNAPGSTIDLNTLLVGADAGGTWAETTSSGAFTAATGILISGGLAAGSYNFTYTVTGVAPCPSDVANFSVDVASEANAGLDNSTSICNTAGSSVNLNTLLSGADAGGAWTELTASGSFSAATGMLTTGGLAAGTYSFTYTVTAAAPCPSDVSNFSVTVEQEANAGADNTGQLCNTAGSTLNMSTLLSGADAGGTWAETTASGAFNVVTGVFDASGLATGTYTFTYTVNGTAPCPPDMATFNVTVTNLPDAGADNTTQVCNTSGSTVNMNTLLVGADPGGTWSELTASGAFNPVTGVLNADGLAAGTYTFAYDLPASGPCPGDQAVMTVTVEQEVDAGADNTTQICNTAGSSVNLNTLLIGADAGGTWAESTASGSFTPATGILNTAGLAAGTYSFNYTVTGVVPCPSDFSAFTVNVEQEVTAGADNTTQVCNNPGTTVDLNTLLSGADLGGSWMELTSSGAFSSGPGILNASGLAGGTYEFKYTVAGVSPCPDDNANFIVTVNPMPTLDVLDDEDLCDEEAHTPQTFGSDVPGTTYNWTVGAGMDIGFGTAGSGNIGSFIGSSGLTDDMTAAITVTPTSPEGCVGNPVTFDITVHPLPIVNFIGNDLVGCAPHLVYFDNLSIGSSNCIWDFGNGVTASGCSTVSNSFALPGTYDVTLTVTSDYGCTSTTTYADYVEVTPRAVAAFSYSPNGTITIDDTEVSFTNSSINADTYTWNFGDGSPNTSDENPTHDFPEAGDISYQVMLVAQNSGDCPDTAYAQIRIDDVILFFVPNVVTPDGDNYNEVFQPIFTAGFDPYDFHLTIFNRWGEIIFESYDASRGWDCTYGEEGLVEDDVYIWQIEFAETNSDKIHKHRGHVTILK